MLTYIAGVSGRVSFDMNADRLTDYALWGMTAQGDSFEFMADIRVDEIEERVSIPNVFVAFCYILKLTMIINQCYGRTTITLFLGPPSFPIVPIVGTNCCYNVICVLCWK